MTLSKSTRVTKKVLHFPLRTRTTRPDSNGPHALRYMMTTVLTWQARAAGETRRVAPWKRSINSTMCEEERCSDFPACVLESAHSSSCRRQPVDQEQAAESLQLCSSLIMEWMERFQGATRRISPAARACLVKRVIIMYR